jgi:signal transduction histidine kinase
MAYFKFACFINFVASFILATFVYGNNPRSAINRRWAAFQGMTAVWGVFFFLSLGAKSYSTALYLDWAIYTIATMIPFLYLRFVYAMVGREFYRGRCLRICFYIMLFFMVMNFTSLFRLGMKKTMYFPYLIVPGPLFYLYLVYFFFCPIYGNAVLYKAIKTSSGNKRNQLWYILVAVSICFIAGGSNFLPQLFQVAAYGNYVVLVYMLVVVYAIVKYQLMDIRLAVTRATVFVIVYTFILGVPFWMVLAQRQIMARYLGDNWPLVPVGIAGVLFALGPLIYNYLSKKAEQALFIKYRKYQQILRRLAKTIGSVKEAPLILQTVIAKIHEAVEPEFIACYIYDHAKNNYNIKHCLPETYSRLPSILEPNTAVVHALWDIKAALVRDSLDCEIALPTQALVVPLFVRGALYGFAVIGERKKIGPYEEDDIGQAEFLSSQVSLALENSFLEQDKVVAAREEQLRRNRSIDNFSASLAHEINNPAFAIMGIAEMVKLRVAEDLKDRLNEKEKQYFDERLSQLSNDAKRIAKLVKAVREFASSSSNAPGAVNVCNLLDSFKEIIGGRLKEENIDFIEQIEGDFNVPGSKVYLEEALVNLAINSIHALNVEKPKDKKIILRIRKNTPHTVLLEFTDNGCGINFDLLEDMFLDFVTTKGSSEGMGMGLARARKIVTIYGGRIWAQSAGAGKGATIFVELPSL